MHSSSHGLSSNSSGGGVAISLKEQAYRRLKDAIVAGGYPPGTFLSERKLVEQFGMSKTPIRAALERLEGEQYVRVSPRQGIVVREPSLREIADQFDVRLALERHVIESIAGNLNDAEIARIGENLRQQQLAVSQENLAETIRLDSQFHLLWCEFHGNREIVATMLRLREKITWVIGLVFKHVEDRMAPNLQEHQELAEAIIAGEAPTAVQRLKRHLEYGKQSLLASD